MLKPGDVVICAGALNSYDMRESATLPSRRVGVIKRGERALVLFVPFWRVSAGQVMITCSGNVGWVHDAAFTARPGD